MSKKVSIAAKPAPRAQADAWVEGAAPPAAAPKMKRLTIDVPEELHRRIKTGCASQGVKMADYVREVLEREFPAA